MEILAQFERIEKTGNACQFRLYDDQKEAVEECLVASGFLSIQKSPRDPARLETFWHNNDLEIEVILFAGDVVGFDATQRREAVSEALLDGLSHRIARFSGTPMDHGHYIWRW